MKLRNGTVAEFSERTQKKKIVCFGAYIMPFSLCNEHEQYGFEDRIVYFIDNDPKKQGKEFNLNGRTKIILSVPQFVERIEPDMVLIITSDYFASIIEQLDGYEQLNDLECYIYPFMKYDEEHTEKIQVRHSDKMLIPKIIHYFWFGGNSKSDMMNQCIDSWRKYCPDYEIIEWNESNYDITKNRFMKEAYDAGKYGFVPDYARLDIIYQYGGLYFDTDVELVKNIDDMLYNEAFFGFGSYGRINTGAGFGSVKKQRVFKSLLEEYEKFSFLNEDGTLNLTTNTMHEEPVFKKYGLKQKDILQEMGGAYVFPSDFMSPQLPGFATYKISCNTISVHHNGFSWGSQKQREDLGKSGSSYEMIRYRFDSD